MRPISTILFFSSIALAALALYVGHHAPSVDYAYVGDCVTRETAKQTISDQHQALVNALYSCGIWKVPLG